MKRLIVQLLALSVAVAVVAMLVRMVHPDAAELGEALTKADLGKGEILARDALAMDNVLWVDLRPHAEYERFHVDGAINVSVLEGDDLLDALFEQEMEGGDLYAGGVVLYCASTECGESHRVRSELEELGTGMTVYVLAGGYPELRRELVQQGKL